MHWYFELLKKTQNGYVYRYSTDCDALDGLIEYDERTDESEVIRPSEVDKDSERRQIKALRSFANVIFEGFPVKRHVCCG